MEMKQNPLYGPVGHEILPHSYSDSDTQDSLKVIYFVFIGCLNPEINICEI